MESGWGRGQKILWHPLCPLSGSCGRRIPAPRRLGPPFAVNLGSQGVDLHVVGGPGPPRLTSFLFCCCCCGPSVPQPVLVGGNQPSEGAAPRFAAIVQIGRSRSLPDASASRASVRRAAPQLHRGGAKPRDAAPAAPAVPRKHDQLGSLRHGVGRWAAPVPDASHSTRRRRLPTARKHPGALVFGPPESGATGLPFGTQWAGTQDQVW
ncbi:hypothetical protein NDU88_005771 [Pleurodeles waltl]|uniref:Uncharacterized protein n=1 Tax=Pleurodeles waltl TaxID=8319 RepID=A0AAV7MD35_PLEWA|nr:hypothetical protein NDU88_005771 [Pleurodeles waltl]